MRTGSSASAMAVFIKIPSTPSSMAAAASEAVPTPASTMTGTLWICSRMKRMWSGLRIPRPEPIGEANGITAAAPASTRRLAMMGSSFV